MTDAPVARTPRPEPARRRLAVGTALASMAVVAYGGRGAYAGTCVGGPDSYACTGAAGALDLTQTLSGAPLTVTLADGFGIATATGNAFTLTGTGGLTFTDAHGASISGQASGIDADNSGAGTLSITTTGAVVGTSGDGIDARNDGTDLTISAAGVSGGRYGIFARNYGSGALSVTATGDVSGTSYSGLFARNGSGFRASGTDLTVSAAGVSGGRSGIDARNYGTGALSITATGAVVGTSGNGIDARNDGTDLTVTAAGVSGLYVGIDARNTGTGALSIETGGHVSGTRTLGILGLNYGTDLTISAASVSGGVSEGIYARNSGTGALSITTTGDVSAGGFGIQAVNRGTDLTVSAAGVSGGSIGVYARNDGSGALSITTTGDIVSGDGIVALNYSGTDLTVATAGATGGRFGIYARNDGIGEIGITATGHVVGRSSAGIVTRTGAGKDTTITLEDGASVSTGSGVAITNDAGDSTVTVKAGAGVTGAVHLGDGTDSLAFAGGDFSGVTAFDGGGGRGDTLSFADGASGVLDGSLVTGFEQVLFGDGSAVSVFDTLTANVAVAAGGGLAAGASPGQLTIAGDFDVAAGAILSFELGGLFAGTDYDVIDVTGTAALADGAIFEILGFGGFVPAVGNTFDILVADTITGSLSDWVFDFQIGGVWDLGLVDLGGREALRLSATPVPLPGAILLGLSGLAGLAALGRRRRAAA